MASISQAVRRCCICALRNPMIPVSRTTTKPPASRIRGRQSQRWQSTNNINTSNPKIVAIVDQIGQLTLLETADLVSSLKARLNIPDMPMGGFVAAGATAPAAPPEEEEAVPKAEEKTLFNLKLQSFEATAKPKVIKEIKQLLGLSLVDSKKFVESAPKMMKESVPKEECEKIVEAMKALGGVVAME